VAAAERVRRRVNPGWAPNEEDTMNVEALMTRNMKTCTPEQNLDCAARLMWDADCGVVPVVDQAQHIVGMITDRDICMAAYMQHKHLDEIAIASIGLKPVVTIGDQEPADKAEVLMQKHQVRRLAVLDRGQRLVGVLSLNDLARVSTRNPRELPSDGIAKTLAAISQPRTDGARA
jgi:CBS domain-containing protein